MGADLFCFFFFCKEVKMTKEHKINDQTQKLAKLQSLNYLLKSVQFVDEQVRVSGAMYTCRNLIL